MRPTAPAADPTAARPGADPARAAPPAASAVGETPPAVPPTSPAAYRLAFLVLRLLFDGYFTTHVSGREHLPPLGTATVVVANHTSALDLFVAGHAVRRPAFFLAKVEATRLPLLGRFLLAVGAVPTNRDQRDTAALRVMMGVLEAGGMAGLAPEGTRSRDGRLAPYDPGCVWLAVRTGSLLVPCAIHGTHRLMPRGARWPRRGPIWVRFGAPIDLTAGGRRLPRQRLQAIADTIQARTLAMLADLAAESGIPNPAVAGRRNAVTVQRP